MFLIFFFEYSQEQNFWVIWQLYFQFFEKPPYCFPQWLYQFTFPPTVYKRSLFSTSSSTFICVLFDDSHSDRCEMITHVVLICISLTMSYVEHLLLAICILSLKKFLLKAEISTQFFSKIIFLNIMLCRRERCDKTIALVKKTAWLLIVQREAET